MPPRSRRSSGIVLILVLWVLSILVVLSIGLGRSTAMDLSLTRYKIGKLKAKYIAWGGVFYSLDKIIKDTHDTTSSQIDTIYQCAVKYETDQTPEQIFKDIPLGEGYFRISYQILEEGKNRSDFFGLSDEESKLNINAVTAMNYEIMANLLTGLGIDSEISQNISTSIVDWKDPDATPFNPENETEDSYYQSLSKPYHCKNLPFDNLNELLLVRDVTPEILGKIKDFLTVFPRDSATLLINLNTASPQVLLALAESYSGHQTNTDKSDAESLVTKILTYRSGVDDQIMTKDDRGIELNNLGLNAKESAIFLTMQRNITTVSKYIRVQAKGVDIKTKSNYKITAVVFRDDLSIVSLELE